jgi:hypothetical protein
LCHVRHPFIFFCFRPAPATGIEHPSKFDVRPRYWRPNTPAGPTNGNRGLSQRSCNQSVKTFNQLHWLPGYRAWIGRVLRGRFHPLPLSYLAITQSLHRNTEFRREKTYALLGPHCAYGCTQGTPNDGQRTLRPFLL